jgi:hypothetical protein
MLDEREVMRDLSSLGFDGIETLPHDALKGLKDETKLFHELLKKLYQSRSLAARALRYALTLSLAPLTGHMMLLVCKKRS